MNHKAAIEHRFQHFLDLFFFDCQGNLVGINEDFKWKSWNARSLRDYIITLSFPEKKNIQRFTAWNEYITCLRCVPFYSSSNKSLQMSSLESAL